MRIGVPREIKRHEYRVGLTPSNAAELISRGHEVQVETHAGASIGFGDDVYVEAGASIASTADVAWADADLVVKVKEPQREEIARLRPEQVLFTYLHLAADAAQARALMATGGTAIAYETVTEESGGLPLLRPMSKVAGRLSVQVGAQALLNPSGGRGVLMGGVDGVPPAKVVILGGGVAGTEAADVALGMGASVCVLDRTASKFDALRRRFGGRLETVVSTTESVEERVLDADLVIGAVLVAGATAPRLVTREMLGRMRRGSALVDISIDQGGCFETSRPTTHDDPTYVVDGIVHYAVANMPGAVAATSTIALTNATLPFICEIADRGWERALARDPHLRAGLNVHDGKIAHSAVAAAIGEPHHGWLPSEGRAGALEEDDQA